MNEPTVHIRSSPYVTYCGKKGETVSYRFVVEHVLVERTTCCKNLFLRICDQCFEAMPKKEVVMADDKDRHADSRPKAGAGIAYDKNGKPFTNGDLIRSRDGHVYKVNGMTIEKKPGTFAAYARDVEVMPPNTPWKDSAAALADDDQTILWGS